MTRAKGLIDRFEIKDAEDWYPAPDDIYVEEIPPTAVRCDATVHSRGTSYAGFDHYIDITVPAHLIGKKVSVIIIPEEER